MIAESHLIASPIRIAPMLALQHREAFMDGFEGDDATAVARISQLFDELTMVRPDVEHTVYGKPRR